MTDIEQQFAGNYVRLVNQCRDLQADIKLKNKMIELIIYDLADEATLQIFGYSKVEELTNFYKTQAISELVAEQNKKATDNAGI